MRAMGDVLARGGGVKLVEEQNKKKFASDTAQQQVINSLQVSATHDTPNITQPSPF